MNLFSKGSSSAADAVAIELLNEPDWYTSGDRVRGQVVISSRAWTQMQVEILLICEEHAELNPGECDAEGYEYRRMTIAGETVDGEAADGVGAFPFELRILDDPHQPNLLPSFDVDSGELGLQNAVRWSIIARVEYKSRVSQITREIAFTPARPRPVSQTQQVFRQEIAMRAYEAKSSGGGTKFAPKVLRTAPVQQFHDAVVVGELHLPRVGVEQRPAVLPLQLSVAASHPHLLAVTRIEVQLVQLAEANIRGVRSPYTVVESLLEPLDDLFIPLEDGIIDLTSFVASAHVTHACPNFTGRWLSMKHHVRAIVTVCALHKRDYVQNVKVSGPITVLPAHNSSTHVDAPPQYTPPETTPQLGGALVLSGGAQQPGYLDWLSAVNSSLLAAPTGN